MSVLAAHIEVARFMAGAFNEQQIEEQLDRNDGWEQRALLLDAIGAAYGRAAIAMADKEQRDRDDETARAIGV